eukprot:g501.t1
MATSPTPTGDVEEAMPMAPPLPLSFNEKKKDYRLKILTAKVEFPPGVWKIITLPRIPSSCEELRESLFGNNAKVLELRPRAAAKAGIWYCDEEGDWCIIDSELSLFLAMKSAKPLPSLGPKHYRLKLRVRRMSSNFDFGKQSKRNEWSRPETWSYRKRGPMSIDEIRAEALKRMKEKEKFHRLEQLVEKRRKQEIELEQKKFEILLSLGELNLKRLNNVTDDDIKMVNSAYSSLNGEGKYPETFMSDKTSPRRKGNRTQNTEKVETSGNSKKLRKKDWNPIPEMLRRNKFHSPGFSSQRKKMIHDRNRKRTKVKVSSQTNLPLSKRESRFSFVKEDKSDMKHRNLYKETKPRDIPHHHERCYSDDWVNQLNTPEYHSPRWRTRMQTPGHMIPGFRYIKTKEKELDVKKDSLTFEELHQRKRMRDAKKRGNFTIGGVRVKSKDKYDVDYAHLVDAEEERERLGETRKMKFSDLEEYRNRRNSTDHNDENFKVGAFLAKLHRRRISGAYLWSWMDDNKSDKIFFHDFCRGIKGAGLRPTPSQKLLRVLYNFFDQNDDGSISYKELCSGLESFHTIDVTEKSKKMKKKMKKKGDDEKVHEEDEDDSVFLLPGITDDEKEDEKEYREDEDDYLAPPPGMGSIKDDKDEEKVGRDPHYVKTSQPHYLQLTKKDRERALLTVTHGIQKKKREELTDEEMEERDNLMKYLRAKLHFSSLSPEVFFAEMDIRKKGRISPEDVSRAMQKLGIWNQSTNKNVRALFDLMDADDNGWVDWKEFKTLFYQSKTKKYKNIERPERLHSLSESKRVAKYLSLSIEEKAKMFDEEYGLTMNKQTALETIRKSQNKYKKNRGDMEDLSKHRNFSYQVESYDEAKRNAKKEADAIASLNTIEEFIPPPPPPPPPPS